MQKYCTKCGEELLPNNKFCVSCGAEINNVDISSKYVKRSGNSPEKNIAIIVLICIAVFILPIFFINNSDSPVTKNEEKKTDYTAEKYKDEVEKNNVVIEEIAKKEKAEAKEQAERIIKAQEEEALLKVEEAIKYAQDKNLKQYQRSSYLDKYSKTMAYVISGYENILHISDYTKSEYSPDSETEIMEYLTQALEDFIAAENTLGNDYVPEMIRTHRYMKLAINSYINWNKALFNSIYYSDPLYLEQASKYRTEGNNYIILSDQYMDKY